MLETSKLLNLEFSFMVLKPRHFGRVIRSTYKVLKCGAGEGLRKLLDRSYETEEVLQRVKEGRDILQTIKERKSSWIGHILRRNFLLKHGIEGKIERKLEVMERQGRRRKQILDEFK